MALRVSMVDGRAFLWDTAGDLTPYRDGHHRITVYDNDGRPASGWISQVTPELELGDELIGDPDMAGLGWWTLQDGWSIDGGTASKAPGNWNAMNRVDLLEIGGLFMAAIDVAAIAAGGVRLGIGNHTLFTTGVAGEFTDLYGTAVDTQTVWVSPDTIDFEGDINSVNLQQVLSPPDTGAWVVDSRMSSTRNWAEVHGDFDPNALDAFAELDEGRHQMRTWTLPRVTCVGALISAVGAVVGDITKVTLLNGTEVDVLTADNPLEGSLVVWGFGVPYEVRREDEFPLVIPVDVAQTLFDWRADNQIRTWKTKRMVGVGGIIEAVIQLGGQTRMVLLNTGLVFTREWSMPPLADDLVLFGTGDPLGVVAPHLTQLNWYETQPILIFPEYNIFTPV